MPDNTIIQQGRFTSDGTTTFIELRQDVDWFRTYNETIIIAGGNGEGAEFLWLRGFAADAGYEYTKLNADDSLALTRITAGGFTLIERSSNFPLGALNTTITSITNAAIPIVNATSTTGLVNGDVVRFVDVTTAQQLGGIDFEIDNLIADTSFRLPFMAQIVAGVAGSFYPVSFGALYNPPYRYISSITAATSAVVELTVTHSYTVNQQVRFQVSSDYKMTQMDGLQGTITAIDTTLNTITVDIDSSAFTAFAFPLTADVPFTPAIVIPFGENPSDPVTFGDSISNAGVLGMNLAAGTDSPAGVNTNVIYWMAGKSFSVDNT